MFRHLRPGPRFITLNTLLRKLLQLLAGKGDVRYIVVLSLYYNGYNCCVGVMNSNTGGKGASFAPNFIVT